MHNHYRYSKAIIVLIVRNASLAYKTGNDVITITLHGAAAGLTQCQWQGVMHSYIIKVCAQMLHSLLKKER